MHPLVVAGLVVTFAVLGVVGYRAEQKRLRLLRHWVRARGLVERPGKVRGWDVRYPGLKLFGRGHSRHADHVFEGAYGGRPVTCLDYVFVTGSGKNRTTHRRAVVVMEAGFVTIPLEIRREHVLDKVGEFLGAGDIDFESAEFSRTFHVASPDRKWAYDVIHTRTMEYLLQAPAFTVAFGLGEVAVWRTGRLEGPAADEALKMARRMIELVPDYVVQQMKGGQR
ncbi:MAG TPA: hypothetical protein PLQ13_05270 [Candidatus Krumholzibacteria bacterium]|nr:hypothetical protein [Candidatus Krumholzibacteria bacterium]